MAKFSPVFMTIGIYLLIILVLGYLSVYLREVWLDFRWLKPLTWLGILIHESAHAIFCLLTGGKITGFRVTAREGYVTHYRPKLPIFGPMLTAIAPMIFGLILLGLLNHFWLKTSLGLVSADLWPTWLAVLKSLNPLTWQAWVLLAIFLNIGVMVGPSLEDLKNIWPIILLSFFLHSQGLAQILALVSAFILINIILFIILILVKIWLNKKRPSARANSRPILIQPKV